MIKSPYFEVFWEEKTVLEDVSDWGGSLRRSEGL